MRVVILAAGYGTRLYPLTRKVAKPLIPINSKPIINFLVDKIEALQKHFPIAEIKIVANNKFYPSFLAWKKKYQVKVKILNDGSNSPSDRLGAIKDIKFAIDNVRTDWLVLGGDNLFDDNLVSFLKFSLDKRPHPTIGIYDVKRKNKAKRFGVVILDKNKQVVRLDEKPSNPDSTLAASCVYFFPKQSLNLLDSFVRNNGRHDASGQYIAWLAKKTKVFGYLFKGRWFDIGHFDSLEFAGKYFK